MTAAHPSAGPMPSMAFPTVLAAPFLLGGAAWMAMLSWQAGLLIGARAILLADHRDEILSPIAATAAGSGKPANDRPIIEVPYAVVPASGPVEAVQTEDLSHMADAPPADGYAAAPVDEAPAAAPTAGSAEPVAPLKAPKAARVRSATAKKTTTR